MGTDFDSDLASCIRSAEIVVPCPDLAASLEFFTKRLGFKLAMILPADAPSVVVVTGHGVRLRLAAKPDRADSPPATLRLACDFSDFPAGTDRQLVAPGGMRVELVDANPKLEIPEGKAEFVLTRMGNQEAWGVGRAGMLYRDLIPGRLGGRFIASHIRIPDGGPVPDYVHFHKIRFQMIFCKSGWVRVVYEDQGEPFVLQAGDCVLQPPEIRHRVLEASPGLEVVEIGCPAIHETHADRMLSLPTPHLLPARDYNGQRFVRHVAAQSAWRPWRGQGFECRDTGIGAATDGLAGARVVRSKAGSESIQFAAHAGEFLFFFVLRGGLGLDADVFGAHALHPGDACVIPAGIPYALKVDSGLEMLEVSLPADLPHRG